MVVSVSLFSLAAFGTLVSGSQIHLPLTEHRRPRSREFTPHSFSPHFSLLEDDGPQNLSLVVIENQDVFYSARVGVGTPAKTFTMLLDTGSSDFWLMSPSVSTTRTTTGIGNTFYDPAESSTSQSSTTSVDVRYGLGAIRGTKATDFMTIGGVTVSNQGFLDCSIVQDLNDISGAASSAGVMDGIWGLAFDGLASSGFKTPLSTMTDQHSIEAVRFSFDLLSGSPRMTIGHPDESLRPRGVTRVPLIKSAGLSEYSFWAVDIDSFTNLDTKNDYCKGSSNCQAIVDTGTTNFGLPNDIFNQLAKDISARRSDCVTFADGTEIACTTRTLHDLPDINFTIGGFDFNFVPEEYAIDSLFITNNNREIEGKLLRWSNLGFTSSFIIGGPWFRAIYTTFDASDPNHPAVEFAAQGPRHKDWTVIVIVSVACGIFGCVICCLCVYHCHFKKRRQPRVLPTGHRRLSDSRSHIDLSSEEVRDQQRRAWEQYQPEHYNPPQRAHHQPTYAAAAPPSGEQPDSSHDNDSNSHPIQIHPIPVAGSQQS